MNPYVLTRHGGAGGKKFTAASDAEARERANQLREKFGRAAKLYRRDAAGWVRV